MNIFSLSFSEFMDATGLTKSNTEPVSLYNQPKLVKYLDVSTSKGVKNIQKYLSFLKKHRPLSPCLALKASMLFHHLVALNPCYIKYAVKLQLGWCIELDRDENNLKPDDRFCLIVARLTVFIKKICYADARIYETISDLKESDCDQYLQRIFLLYNLMKTAFPLIHMIIYFARYHQCKYLILRDLNFQLALHMATLYNKISHLLNFLLEQEYSLARSQYDLLLLVAQKLSDAHQTLYLFFYNKYYSEFTHKIHVNWLKLDHLLQKTKLKNKLKSKKSMNSTTQDTANLDLSSFEQTYFGFYRQDKVIEQLDTQVFSDGGFKLF